VTNGVLLNLSTAKKLIDLDVDEISISLNVNNSDDYKKYIGGSNYLSVKDNIKNLIKYRNKKHKNNISIFVQYLDYTNNSDKFEKDIKQWSKIMRYSDKCYIHPIVNEGGFNETKLANYKNTSNIFPCYSPIITMAVRVNGDIYTCDSSFFNGNTKIDELYLGNINKVDYFKEIHSNKNSKIYKILEAMKKDDYCKLKNCRQCHNYKLGTNPFFRTIGPWQKNQKWW
jgi:radical SAM protein with 4Fe4S-binding SPASM domain